MSKIEELEGKLESRQKLAVAVLAEAGEKYDFSKVTSLDGTTAGKVDGYRALETEMSALGEKIDRERAAELAAEAEKVTEHKADKTGRALAAAAGESAGRDDSPPQMFGEMLSESAAFKEFKGGQGPIAQLKLDKSMDMRATLFQTSAGWAPQVVRSGLVVPSQQRPIQVVDLIPSAPTSQSSYKYMLETTFTNNAAETAEGGTYAESALALTEEITPIQKIATFLPVTDEQLEDVDGIAAYLENRLRFMVMQRLDSQILVGNGSTPNLKGLNNISGIQTQAKGSDPTPDAIYKAMTLLRTVGRVVPNAVIINPLDWQDVKLLKTTDGIYIWGSPTDVGPDRIWGLNVALSDSQTQNTAIVADLTFTQLLIRRDLEVQISNSHSTFFVEGKQAVRVDMRVGLVVTRPQAICTVTGI